MSICASSTVHKRISIHGVLTCSVQDTKRGRGEYKGIRIGCVTRIEFIGSWLSCQRLAGFNVLLYWHDWLCTDEGTKYIVRIYMKMEEMNAYSPGFHSSHLPLWCESEQVLNHLLDQGRLFLTQTLELLGGVIRFEFIQPTLFGLPHPLRAFFLPARLCFVELSQDHRSTRIWTFATGGDELVDLGWSRGLPRRRSWSQC